MSDPSSIRHPSSRDAVPLLKEIERQLAEWPTAPFSHDVVRGLLALVQQQREEIANEKVLHERVVRGDPGAGRTPTDGTRDTVLRSDPVIDAVPLLKEMRDAERRLRSGGDVPLNPPSYVEQLRKSLKAWADRWEALVEQQREEIANEQVLRDEQRACEFHEEGDGSPCGECIACLKDQLRACAAEKEKQK